MMLANSLSRTLDFLHSPPFPIFMIVFVDVLGLGITIPVLPLFAQNELKADPAQITTLTSVFFGAQFLAARAVPRRRVRIAVHNPDHVLLPARIAAGRAAKTRSGDER